MAPKLLRDNKHPRLCPHESFGNGLLIFKPCGLSVRIFELRLSNNGGIGPFGPLLARAAGRLNVVGTGIVTFIGGDGP